MVIFLTYFFLLLLCLGLLGIYKLMIKTGAIKVVGILGGIILSPFILLFLHELLFVECGQVSPLKRTEAAIIKKLNERAKKDMAKYSDTKRVVVRQIIMVYKPNRINDDEMEVLNTDNIVKHEYMDYEKQVKKLKSWAYLDKYLPKHINKTEYIDWLSKCQYPFYLAQIHFRESSFDTGAGNGSYIGLGQHHPDFINKCGYTVKEYNSNWRVQVYVSIEYINKYVKSDINKVEELYALWLKSSWKGEKVIYDRKSVIVINRKKYKPYNTNSGLDDNGDGDIDLEDLHNKFKKLA